MKRMAKILSIWFLIGAIYYALEGFYRLPRGGYANVIMLLVGGICGGLVGSINQIPAFYNMKIIVQSLIGTIITLVVEFLSGLILNIYLGLHIWDYSRLPFNILGQICLPFALIWFIMMPLAIWLEDTFRYEFLGEGQKYSLLSIYLEFITFK